MQRLLRNDNPERMGLFEFVWPDALPLWVEQGYPTDDQGEAIPPAEHFGWDMELLSPWFDVLPMRGHEELVDETDEWHVKRNGAGAALKYWKNKSGTPEHMDFLMTSREVWERDYRHYLLELDPQRIDIAAVRPRIERRRAEGVFGCYGHVFVFENMRSSLGDICLYESLLLDPGWIHDYNRVYTDFFKLHYQYLFDQTGLPDAVWMFEDLGYKGTTFCSPKVYDELIFPYYRELIEWFKSFDLPVLLHSCGYVEELAPRFIELGFDGMHPMEVKAGCDAVRMAGKYADKLVFIGGMDERILETGDRDAIRAGVTHMVEGMKRAGARYVFGSDHSLSTNVAYDDYRFALDVFREQMAY